MTVLLRSTALAVFIALSAAGTTDAACTHEGYHVVRDFVDQRSGYGSVRISVPSQEFTLANLLCLATEFETHPGWRDIRVLIFNSDEAAASFDASGMSDWHEVINSATGQSLGTVNIGGFRKELRAIYTLNVADHIHRLEILPLGFETSDAYATKIDQPSQSNTHCRWELVNRCVFSMSQISFPEMAKRASGSAEVTLTGRIRSDGTIAELRVTDVDGESDEIRRALTAATLDNLSTWWLEPHSQIDPFRLTYEYIIDRSLAANSSVIMFQHPDRVTVRGNPSR
jgi:hypothetical protein